MNNNKILFCRICGLYHGKDYQGNDYFPWGIDGNSPSFDICECCGAEFGFDDNCIENITSYRNNWFKKGNTWLYPRFIPQNWSLEEQIKNIPEEYR